MRPFIGWPACSKRVKIPALSRDASPSSPARTLATPTHKHWWLRRRRMTSSSGSECPRHSLLFPRPRLTRWLAASGAADEMTVNEIYHRTMEEGVWNSATWDESLEKIRGALDPSRVAQAPPPRDGARKKNGGRTKLFSRTTRARSPRARSQLGPGAGDRPSARGEKQRDPRAALRLRDHFWRPTGS